MPKGENLRLEFETRPNGGPKGGEQSDEQSQNAGPDLQRRQEVPSSWSGQVTR